MLSVADGACSGTALRLRQRVGFALESLGLSHPRLDVWREHRRRGSLLVLVPGEPFSSEYSERWSISTKAPAPVLALLTGSCD